MKHVEIEDVLSSIRRLVSEEPKPRQKPRETPKPDRLVLTPSLRVPDTAAIAEAARPRPKFSTSRTESRPVTPTPPQDPVLLTDPSPSAAPRTEPGTEASPARPAAGRADDGDRDDAPGAGGMLSRLVEQEVARAFSEDQALEDDEVADLRPETEVDEAADKPQESPERADRNSDMPGQADVRPEPDEAPEAARASLENPDAVADDAKLTADGAPVATDERPASLEWIDPDTKPHSANPEAHEASDERHSEQNAVDPETRDAADEDEVAEVVRPDPAADRASADARPDPIARFVQHMDGVQRLAGAQTPDADPADALEDEADHAAAYLDEEEPGSDAEAVLRDSEAPADTDIPGEELPRAEPDHVLAPPEADESVTEFASLEGKIAVLEMLVARQKRDAAPSVSISAPESPAVDPAEAAPLPPAAESAKADHATSEPGLSPAEPAADTAHATLQRVDRPAEPVTRDTPAPEMAEEDISVAMAEQPEPVATDPVTTEPDAVEPSDADGDQVLNWEDHVPPQDRAAEPEVETAPDPDRQSREMQAAAEPANTGANADLPATSAGGQAPAMPALDEEVLRDMVSDIVRQELQGVLGERITRNVRKLVRREIHRMLMSQELD